MHIIQQQDTSISADLSPVPVIKNLLHLGIGPTEYSMLVRRPFSCRSTPCGDGWWWPTTA